MKNTKKIPNIIIPCAGLGKRMMSYGPKCLIDLGIYKSVLNHQLKTIQQLFPKSKIFIVAGFKRENIREFIKKWNASEHILGSPNIEVLENTRYYTTTYTESIKIGLEQCKTNDAIIIMGDILFNEHILDKINLDSSFVLSTTNKFIKNKKIGVMSIDGYATYFGYGIKKKWAQIIYLKGQEFELFKTLAKPNLFTFEILNKIIEQGGKFKIYEPSFMKIFEVDNIRDIKEIKKKKFI